MEVYYLADLGAVLKVEKSVDLKNEVSAADFGACYSEPGARPYC